MNAMVYRCAVGGIGSERSAAKRQCEVNRKNTLLPCRECPGFMTARRVEIEVDGPDGQPGPGPLELSRPQKPKGAQRITTKAGRGVSMTKRLDGYTTAQVMEMLGRCTTSGIPAALRARGIESIGKYRAPGKQQAASLLWPREEVDRYVEARVARKAPNETPAASSHERIDTPPAIDANPNRTVDETIAIFEGKLEEVFRSRSELDDLEALLRKTLENLRASREAMGDKHA